MARFYSKADASAPAMTYFGSTWATPNPGRFANIKAILKACLVDGYTGRPAAGWALVDETEWTITLHNAAGRFVTLSNLLLFGTGANRDHFFRVYLHNTFTGISGGVPTGEGVVSGIAPGSAQPQAWGALYMFAYEATVQWVVLADETAFYFCLYGSPQTFDTNTNEINQNLDNSNSLQTLYVGDDRQGNFVSAGGMLFADTGSNYPTANVGLISVSLTTLRDPTTGLLVDTGGVSASVEALWSPGGLAYNRDPFSRDWFVLSPIEWVCTGKVVGQLKGGFIDLSRSNNYASQILSEYFGAPSPVKLIHHFTPALKADGHSYMLGPINRQCPNSRRFFLTDNPAIW